MSAELPAFLSTYNPFDNAKRTLDLCIERGTPAEKEGLLLLLRAVETRFSLKHGGGERHAAVFRNAVEYWEQRVIDAPAPDRE